MHGEGDSSPCVCSPCCFAVDSHTDALPLAYHSYSTGKPVMIVTEYMENGSLDGFLRVSAPWAVNDRCLCETRAVVRGGRPWVAAGPQHLSPPVSRRPPFNTAGRIGFLSPGAPRLDWGRYAGRLYTAGLWWVVLKQERNRRNIQVDLRVTAILVTSAACDFTAVVTPALARSWWC